MNPELELIHDLAKQQFRLGQAVVDYQLKSGPEGQYLDFTRTYVPPALRGQGLAEKLVRAALRWAKQQPYPITASCWYVARFLPKPAKG